MLPPAKSRSGPVAGGPAGRLKASAFSREIDAIGRRTSRRSPRCGFSSSSVSSFAAKTTAVFRMQSRKERERIETAVFTSRRNSKNREAGLSIVRNAGGM